MDLTLPQLRALVAVHDAGSFTVAADKLLTAQSSLSRTVADVERRIGAKLFDRNTRSVTPTPTGRAVVAAARRALRGLDVEMAHIDAVLRGEEGTVRIATLPSLAAILLPGVVSAFRSHRPGVAISVSDVPANGVLEQLVSGDADLAVTVEPPARGDLVVRRIARDRFCLLIQPSHPLAEMKAVPWTALRKGDSFIDADPSSSMRQHVDRALAESGVSPRRDLSALSISGVAGLVAAGLGVTAVPSLVVPLTMFADLRLIPLIEPVVMRRIALVLPRGRVMTAPVAAFAQTLAGSSGVVRPELPVQAEWTEPQTLEQDWLGL